MQKGLVSILTPCYNMESYIHRLLDSVQRQTYGAIEMWVIDDGSTDGTAAVVRSYQDRFEKRGFGLHYVRQENQGQSVAIKNGLRLVRGEFMTWPDADDFYSSPDAIAKMVKALQIATPDVAMARVRETVVGEDAATVYWVFGKDAGGKERPQLFEDCLYVRNNFYYAPGGYMVRMSALNECLGDSYDIYTEKKAGQNWQLMLPILYKYRCVTIPETLFSVVYRMQSHSRGGTADYEISARRLHSYETTIQATLDRMKMDTEEKRYYKREVRLQYVMKNLFLAYQCGERRAYMAHFHKLSGISGRVGLADGLMCFVVATGLFQSAWIRKEFRRVYRRLNLAYAEDFRV